MYILYICTPAYGYETGKTIVLWFTNRCVNLRWCKYEQRTGTFSLAPGHWPSFIIAWWRHNIETLSSLLALSEGNPPVTDGFSHNTDMFSFMLGRPNCWTNSQFTCDYRRLNAHVTLLLWCYPPTHSHSYTLTVAVTSYWARLRLKSPTLRLFTYLLNCLIRRRSKKTSELCVTGISVGNSPVIGEYPVQLASNAENVSIWWRHHDCEGPCWPVITRQKFSREMRRATKILLSFV